MQEKTLTLPSGTAEVEALVPALAAEGPTDIIAFLDRVVPTSTAAGDRP